MILLNNCHFCGFYFVPALITDLYCCSSCESSDQHLASINSEAVAQLRSAPEHGATKAPLRVSDTSRTSADRSAGGSCVIIKGCWLND